ncbi:MAG TPA: hypothetical protein VHF51_19625 [Solirubrobacteraceae bacterium]|jgi:hypothetical protein|nr:hypothetical protein [Solirubrobacteraceae bacterium]
MTEPPKRASELEAIYAELVAHAVSLAEATYDTTRMLAEVLAERQPRPEPEATADRHSPIPADVLEVATLDAQAGGMSVERYLREAVLAHSERSTDPERSVDGDLAERLRRARLEALRMSRSPARAAARQTAAVEARAEASVAQSRRRRKAPSRDSG